MAREPSLQAHLARAGFQYPERALHILQDQELAGILAQAGSQPQNRGQWLMPLFADVADPDQALFLLSRLSQAARPQCHHAFREVIRSRAVMLLKLLGGSRMLGEWLIANPHTLAAWPAPVLSMGAAQIRQRLLASVGADAAAEVPVASRHAGDGGMEAMRSAYWELMAGLAAQDFHHPDPVTLQPQISAALSDMASAAVETSLALARAGVAKENRMVRLAVMGMGKVGGRELNYRSDVDVLYVVAPAPGQDAEAARQAATQVATCAAQLCTLPAAQPPLWQIDASLRPEGKDGALVRTIDAYTAYYSRWAQNWEFQALLKARLIAGDQALGREFTSKILPFAWQAANRDGFVREAQAMRQRIEHNLHPADQPWHIKLGPGGLRDVEFMVQLLQMVHGRNDPTLQIAHTETAITALSAGGYISRSDALELAAHYRFLRTLEHRRQLMRMRRTHLFPRSEAEQTSLARGMGYRREQLIEQWRQTQYRVRYLHEKIFYRPLLPAVAQLSVADVSLSPQQAQVRLEALGYQDAGDALRHIHALTAGLSRRAAIQTYLLPVMLAWLATGPDPDAGLLSFRNISEKLGATHWYLKLLRDSATAAENLAKVLSSSRYAAQKLEKNPEAISWLETAMMPPTVPLLQQQMHGILHRHSNEEEAGSALRAMRSKELLRAALYDVIHGVSHRTGEAILTPATEVVIAGAVQLAEQHATMQLQLDTAPGEFLVVAMGRLGGREIGYSSDADLMYVYRHTSHQGHLVAQKWANQVAITIGQLLGGAGHEPALEIDLSLRPEGKNGPVVRSLDSYREYYERWARGWERQALLRARPIAGSVKLGIEFEQLIEPWRYPATVLPAQEVALIRRMKARMEAERLPRGAAATTHVKLGRGGLSDVEWAIQFLQLQEAFHHPKMRTTNTLAALNAALEFGLISPHQERSLSQAWTLATRIRQANTLWSATMRANKVDVLPHHSRDIAGIAALLGFDGNSPSQDLENLWLSVSRQARKVMGQIFYADPAQESPGRS